MCKCIFLIVLCASTFFSEGTFAGYMKSNKDEALEEKVRAVLRGLPISGSSFDIGVHRDEVLLVGMIESPVLEKTVVSTISAVPGVLRVHNELKSGPRSDKTYDSTMAKQLDVIIENSGIAGPQRIAAYVIEGGLYLMGPVTEAEGNKVVKSVVAWSSSHPELKKVVKLFVYWKDVPGLVTVKGCQIYTMDRTIDKSEKLSWEGRCVKGIAEGQGVINIVGARESIKGEGVFEHGSLVRGDLKYQRGEESFIYKGGIFNLLPQGPGTAKVESADVNVEVVGTFDEGQIKSWTTATNLKTGEVRRFGESRAVVTTTEPDSDAGDEGSGIGDIIGGLLQGAGQAMQTMGGAQYGKGVLIEGIGNAVAGDETVANRSIQSLDSGQTASYGQGLTSGKTKKENCRYTSSGSLRGCVIPDMNQCIKVQPGRDGQAVRVNGCSQAISIFICSSGQGQRSANAVSPLCSSLVNPSNAKSIPEPLLYSVNPGQSIPVSGSSVTWACPFGFTDVLGWDGKTLKTVCYETGLQTDSR